MHLRVRSALLRALVSFSALALAAMLWGAGGATAKPALVELRAEGPQGVLDPGTWYVTDTERIRRSRNGDECKRRGGTIRVRGATALGVAQTGSKVNRKLRQVRIRRDEAGLFVCEIGSVLGRPFTDPQGFAGWSYYLNGTFGSASADQVTLRNGDQVFWVFSDWGPAQANTGPQLELRKVPAGTTDTTFRVRVIERAFDGGKGPALGVTITGAKSFTELGNGRYEVEVKRGFSQLRASRDVSVPSAPVKVCSRAKRAKCPLAHGRTIYGSAKGDRLRGTRGWDVIASGKGDDRIDLTKPGRDRVNCGPGKDEVVIKKGDRAKRIGRSCERVIRKR